MEKQPTEQQVNPDNEAPLESSWDSTWGWDSNVALPEKEKEKHSPDEDSQFAVTPESWDGGGWS